MKAHKLFCFVLLLAVHLVACIPFRNPPKPPPEQEVENDLGDPMMDKAEDLDEDKAEDKDDGQGVPILGDDREDDNGDVANNDANENEEDHELKFVKIPDDVKKLSVEKLRPVDHMDAVRMEQDGHVNKEFHKEMFLGDHEEFENERYVEAESKLKDIVYK